MITYRELCSVAYRGSSPVRPGDRPGLIPPISVPTPACHLTQR